MMYCIGMSGGVATAVLAGFAYSCGFNKELAPAISYSGSRLKLTASSQADVYD